MSDRKEIGNTPKTAMILAAGFGKRLRPITDHTPKPLVEVAGRSLLERILDHLAAVGVEKVVINLHHLGDAIEERLAGLKSPQIVFSHEAEILETGGGVKQALPELGSEPFYVINGDVCWLDGLTPALQRLAEFWDPEAADVLLLLQPIASAVGYEGWRGDYFMTPGGRLRRRTERNVAPFLFSGVQILKPEVFKDCGDGPFSLNLIYDKAEELDRLWGLRHDGEWFHVGTARALSDVEAVFHHLSLHSATK
jgi:MurNAc alpha-1-phosphate uridylyltransferase